MGRIAPICLALWLALSAGSPCLADDASADASARKAGAAVRAALPPPSPGVRVDFEGDLVLEDLWAGEVRLSVRLAKLGRSYAWRVTEDFFMDWAGGEVREKLMVHAGRDLAVQGGTYERSDGEGTVSLGFSRAADALQVQRRVRKGDTWAAPQQVTLAASPGAVTGLASALLFLRSVRDKTKGTWILPWIPTPSFKQPESATPSELRLTLKGPGRFEHADTRIDTFIVRFESGASQWDLHFDRARTSLVAMISGNGPVRIVPKGLGGERIAVDPRAPATTWKQAFLKFGFGYHMAREELLREAFHWDRMYEHETKVLKRWPADKPMEAFREAWIAEFVAGSKHRDVPATRRLLSMTLATGKVKKETPTDVVFWAHPNFGGGTQRTYFLEQHEGRWGIVRIVFEE